jgi:hypothetical protein
MSSKDDIQRLIDMLAGNKAIPTKQVEGQLDLALKKLVEEMLQ